MEKDKAEVSVKVVNVVASATLGQRVNLNSIVKVFPNAQYPSRKFPGIVLKLRKPRTSALIFRSGKIICAGGRTEDEAYKAVENIVYGLKKKRLVASKNYKFRVNNMVVTANLGRTVDLDSISKWQKTIYEPEQFPALIHRMDDPKVVFLIFSSGKVICLGATNEDEVHKGIQKLIHKLNIAGAFRSLSLDRIGMKIQECLIRNASAYKLRLKDFAISRSDGKTCIYVDGLWCKNRLCNGPACKFANLIQRKVVNGAYGCWGFHWQERWYTEQVKQSQRKFLTKRYLVIV